MRRLLPRLLAAIAWLMLTGVAVARPASHARLLDAAAPRPAPGLMEVRPANRQEGALLADAADGRLERHSLLTAALIAGGVSDPVRIRGYERKLAAWSAELQEAGVPDCDPRSRAAAILRFMHGSILTGGYRLEASNLAELLDTGRFNCVSSAVLFNCLAQRCGLAAAAIECPAHAFSLVQADGQWLEVETTCADWFEVAERSAESRQSLAATIGQEYAEGRLQVRRRKIDDAGLIAILYYNRGVDLLAERRFQEAVWMNLKSLRFDVANPAARANLLAAVNNWAIDVCGNGRFAEAAAILDAGLDVAPDHALFHSNYVAVHQQWAEQLAAADRPADALAVLSRAARRLPDPPFLPSALDAGAGGLHN